MFFKFLYSLTLLLVLAPALVLAADDTVAPEFNPICWEEQACLEERRKINPNAEASGGWINTEEPCEGKFGKCLPAGVVETEIAFGGQKRFAHVGQFIQVTYKYAVGVAGIVATVMVIVAGFQWITSGGNSERVAGAKKRIGGALMGLFLAYLSYAILDTLNPALVSMRLPRVWLTKPLNLMPGFCSETPSNTLFALAAPAEDQRRNVEFPSQPNFEYSKERTPRMLHCGKRFFIKNGGTAVCRGDYCNNNNEICAQFGEDPANPDKYYCAPGKMAGKITNSIIIEKGCLTGTLINVMSGSDEEGEGWEKPDVVGNSGPMVPGDIDIANQLYVVCKSGAMKRVGGTFNPTIVGDHQVYSVLFTNSELEKAVSDCDRENPRGAKGAALALWMNEECDPFNELHFIGRNGLDLGDQGVGSGWWRNNYQQINDQYFITIESLRQPLRLNIEATRIYDIDNNETRQRKYNHLLN